MTTNTAEKTSTTINIAARKLRIGQIVTIPAGTSLYQWPNAESAGVTDRELTGKVLFKFGPSWTKFASISIHE